MNHIQVNSILNGVVFACVFLVRVFNALDVSDI